MNSETSLTEETRGFPKRNMSPENGNADQEYKASFNTTLFFPSYATLLQMRLGEFCTSEPFTVYTEQDGTFDFCVKLYPRGGGHRAQFDIFSSTASNRQDNRTPNQKPKSGFGMAYRVLPWMGGKTDPLHEKVGLYLQYLPRQDSKVDSSQTNSVDATFALRLCGKQVTTRRFDVEWRAGMRFVPLAETKLALGQANDFGAHLLRTILLDDFLGVQEKDYTDPNFDKPVECQVEVYLHQKPSAPVSSSLTSSSSSSSLDTPILEESFISRSLGALKMQDMRQTSPNQEPLRVGQVVVPVIRKLSQRPRMFQQGAYPGVEYRILRMIDPSTGNDVFYHRPGVDYEIKPIYPLVAQLERPWPVRIPEATIPKLITPTQYNTISAVGSLLTAISGLFMAFILSQAVSLFFIPSRSMEPTLQVGDVLLVEKVTPRLFPNAVIQKDQVVLFHPPTKLQDIVSATGGRISDRDLFVKRVAAAQPGDILEVTAAGDVQINGHAPLGRRDLCTAEPLRLIERYIQPGATVVGPGQIAVLGDCASVSVDSRVWGTLPKSQVVGRPLIRIWPLERFGKVDELPTTQSDYWKD